MFSIMHSILASNLYVNRYYIKSYYNIKRYSCFTLGNQSVVKRNLYSELDNILKTLKNCNIKFSTFFFNTWNSTSTHHIVNNHMLDQLNIALCNGCVFEVCTLIRPVWEGQRVQRQTLPSSQVYLWILLLFFLSKDPKIHNPLPYFKNSYLYMVSGGYWTPGPCCWIGQCLSLPHRWFGVPQIQQDAGRPLSPIKKRVEEGKRVAVVSLAFFLE